MNNIDEFINYFQLIHQDLNKFKFSLDVKNSIYIPLFTSAIDHCIAINFLNKEGMTVSMYALIRPSLECYLRAMWVKHSNNDIQEDGDLSKMHFPKNIDNLIKQIDDAVPKFSESSFLQTTFGKIVPNLHDFTHGGIQSIARQYTDDSLTNIRDEQEIKSILKFSVFISSLAYGEIIQENISTEVFQEQKVSDSAKKLTKK